MPTRMSTGTSRSDFGQGLGVLILLSPFLHAVSRDHEITAAEPKGRHDDLNIV